MIDSEELLKRRGKIIPTKKTLSQEIKRSISLLIFTLLLIIVTTSIVFLLNTSQGSQKGYTLQLEQNKKEDLINEDRNLMNKLIEVQSYKFIQDSPLIKNMVKPETIEYIKEDQQ